MQKPISPAVHGVLDYTTSAAIAAAPTLLDFPEPAQRLCYGLAGGYTGLSMFTDYPMSAKRVIPWKAHGAADAIVGAALPAMPWVLGFARHKAARNFILGIAATTMLVAALTDWSRDD